VRAAIGPYTLQGLAPGTWADEDATAYSDNAPMRRDSAEPRASRKARRPSA
jgi:23S rRNA pseudouridine2457 synthase